MRNLVLSFCVALVGAGCGSLTGPNQEYIAPAISGKVLDATTGQPLAGVRVTRYTGTPPPTDPFPDKGGVELMKPAPVATDAAGAFYIPAVKSAHVVFTPSSSLMFTLVAQRSGYLNAVTNLDLVQIKPERTARGPEINAGVLRLQSVK